MPDFLSTLIISGRISLPLAIMNQMVACKIIQRHCSPGICELFFKGENIQSATSLLENTLSITLQGELLFEGDVVESNITYQRNNIYELHIKAHDAMWKLSRNYGTVCFNKMTLNEMTKKIFESYGINRIKITATRNPYWHYSVRYNETDLDFLRRIHSQAGTGFFLQSDQSLQVYNLENGYGREISITDDIYNFCKHRNRSDDVTNCNVLGWNTTTNEVLQSEVTVDSKGARHDISHVNAIDDSLVRAFSKTILLEHQINKQTISAAFCGMSQLNPGRQIRIRENALASAVSCVAARVTHSFDVSTGYVTEISSSIESAVASTGSLSILYAKVVDINDPQKRCRIKVSYPTLDDIESDWLNPLLPGLGNKKGILVLPDVGDFVVVGLNNNDPAQGIVLGSVCGPGDSLNDPKQNGGEFRAFRIDTKDGNKIILSDDNDGIRIESSCGLLIHLDSTTKRVKVIDNKGYGIEISPDEFSIKARHLKIDAKDIDINSDSNIMFKAQRFDFD